MTKTTKRRTAGTRRRTIEVLPMRIDEEEEWEDEDSEDEEWGDEEEDE